MCKALGIHPPDSLADLCDPQALNECHLIKPHELRAFEAKHAPSSSSWTLAEIAAPPEVAPGDRVTPLLPAGLARFAWAVEYAHEDAILAVTCAHDPSCVLSSGLDRCLRMRGPASGISFGVQRAC